MAAKTHQDGYKPKPTTNVATVMDKVGKSFAMMNIGETFFKVSPIQPFLPIKSTNDNSFSSLPNHIYQINKVMGVEINKGLSREKSLVMHIDFINKHTIHILIDSGVNDYYFANKSFLFHILL